MKLNILKLFLVFAVACVLAKAASEIIPSIWSDLEADAALSEDAM